MRYSFRRPLLLLIAIATVLILQVLLSSCASTKPRPAAAPRLPDPPVPSECTRAGFTLFAADLAPLPGDYLSMTRDQRAKAMLVLKSDDTTQYKLLRSQALRCAR